MNGHRVDEPDKRTRGRQATGLPLGVSLDQALRKPSTTSTSVSSGTRTSRPLGDRRLLHPREDSEALPALAGRQ